LLVNKILETKEFKNQIIDKKRINIILKKIKIKSKRKKIDSKITNKIWKSIIAAYIDYEFRNFKKK
jgi:chorismate mutase